MRGTVLYLVGPYFGYVKRDEEEEVVGEATSLVGTTRLTFSGTVHLDTVKEMVLGRMRGIEKREQATQPVMVAGIGLEVEELARATANMPDNERVVPAI